MSDDTERKDLSDALKRPAHGAEGEMGFGAKPEGAAPEGSADAAVGRAAAGWSGRREGGTAERASRGGDASVDGPRVPTERPDPAAAARGGGPGSTNRPGFDLGGASGGAPGGDAAGPAITESGPVDTPVPGTSDRGPKG